MPDGPEQEARDRRLNAKPGDNMTNPDKWSDPSWQRYAWGTDVMQDALNCVTLRPFSPGNLHRRAVFTKPRPTFPFVQDLPRNHGAVGELRYGLSSRMCPSLLTTMSRHYHSLSLRAAARKDSAHKTMGRIASPIRSLSKRAQILNTASALATLCACVYIKSS